MIFYWAHNLLTRLNVFACWASATLKLSVPCISVQCIRTNVENIAKYLVYYCHQITCFFYYDNILTAQCTALHCKSRIKSDGIFLDDVFGMLLILRHCYRHNVRKRENITPFTYGLFAVSGILLLKVSLVLSSFAHNLCFTKAYKVSR